MNRKQARSRWAEILGHDAEITGHVGPKYPFSAPKAKTVYVAGDTVWRPEVDQALAQHKPDVVILNTGSALVSGFEEHPIIMGKQDTLQATKSAPKAAIVAVHMDSVNHMSLSRKELREFVQDNKIQDRVVIPEDGEVMKF